VFFFEKSEIGHSCPISKILVFFRGLNRKGVVEGPQITAVQPESLSDFWKTNFLGVRSQKKAGKRRGKGNPLKNNTPEKNKISGTLVRLLWRAAAPGLKPLRLPRAQMEVHIHLKNAFPDRIGNRRITSGYNLWFASHPSPGLWFGKKLFFFLALFVLLPTTQRGFCEDDAFARILAELF